ncbi:hypothetical protein R4282_10550 [Rhodococcus oxybenzonivorans]|uniref:hypothetical protein n=1 Tax=Rhodococcus oxybenzonivorans TaxID=1990687 RepID=UPI00295597E2|nr:hypothetical protein [Rhodococcus oxybenzonivorans]MDV7353445.1 hypothetical protein [Rhodococcus oxybenzonivorans]
MKLVGDRDAALFSREISQVCAEPQATDGQPHCGEVLAWVVDAIVGVITARLGAAGPGETFVLDLHFTDGTHVDVDDLSSSERWVLQTVAAFLAEEVAAGEQLLAVAEQFDPTQRADTLADAIIWLDFVLDVDLPDPPDVTTT